MVCPSGDRSTEIQEPSSVVNFIVRVAISGSEFAFTHIRCENRGLVGEEVESSGDLLFFRGQFQQERRFAEVQV